jgi:hypothetical protein
MDGWLHGVCYSDEGAEKLVIKKLPHQKERIKHWVNS